MTKNDRSSFLTFTVRVIVIHFLTYFVFGLVMSNLLGYEELFQREIIRDFMLPLNSHAVLGVAMQPIRGLLFALALWPIWDVFLEKKNGWLKLWGIFLVFGILSTTGAAPSSIEGALYSKLPLWYHLLGIPEISLQTLTFSVLLLMWEKGNLFQSSSKSKEKNKGFFSQIFAAIVISCFAYIGYAVASVGVFFLTADEIDFSSAAGDAKSQIMFVVAFIFNVIYTYIISKQWVSNKISQWVIFIIAWLLDSLVIFFYQLVVFGSSNLLFTFIIGLLPAAIIAFTIPKNYKKKESV